MLPNIPESNFMIQLRKDNAKLIHDLWRYLKPKMILDVYYLMKKSDSCTRKVNLKEVENMKLEIGQTWVSESHPYEDFRIYDGIEDSFVLSDIENYNGSKFEDLPEKAKIYFWERIDKESFDEFLVKQKGSNYENTYPYAWAGECKKGILINKIKKYDMSLIK